MKAKHARHGFVLLALIFALGLSACSIIFVSLFSDEIMYTEANVNLWDIVPGLKDYDYFDFALRRMNGYRDLVGIYAGTPKGRYAIFLDAEDLSEVRVFSEEELRTPGLESSTLSRFIFAKPGGDYVIGNCVFDANFGHTVSPFSGSTEGGSYVEIHDLGTYSVVFYSPTMIPSTGIPYLPGPGYDTYNTVWLDFPIERVYASVLLPGVSDGLRFLVRRSDTWDLGYVYATPDNLTSTFNIIPFPSIDFNSEEYNQQIWLTEDGIVARPEKSSALTRYDFFGKPKDSIRFESEETDVYFEPDGSTFYVYRRNTGVLTKAATWWE